MHFFAISAPPNILLLLGVQPVLVLRCHSHQETSETWSWPSFESGGGTGKWCFLLCMTLFCNLKQSMLMSTLEATSSFPLCYWLVHQKILQNCAIEWANTISFCSLLFFSLVCSFCQEDRAISLSSRIKNIVRITFGYVHLDFKVLNFQESGEQKGKVWHMLK